MNATEPDGAPAHLLIGKYSESLFRGVAISNFTDNESVSFAYFLCDSVF
ncbi:hypothetical protein BMETH_191_0 [methanotrophic bacterial endosymbiont of Bathymodiolus sp.]|nr:hypothetical protein BMETH_191_0 [methanotrophic bacterial endosymbiont of Bathymodiolus sp.]